MTSIISDTELLELSIEPFEEEMQVPEDGPTTKQDQQSSQYSNESQKQQTLMGTSHETKRPFQPDDQQKEQQQTLKALNKKLDSLHTHLERAKQLYATQDQSTVLSCKETYHSTRIQSMK